MKRLISRADGKPLTQGMGRASWMLVGCGAVAYAGCDGGPDRNASRALTAVEVVERRAPFRIELMNEYGLEEVPPSDVGPDGGPLLGQVRDVAEGPNGDVYVLDVQYKKVAVFKADGTFDRVILGGNGEGPGEFRLPISLDVDHLGRVHVYDFSLGRLTVFETTDSVIRTVRIGGSHKDIMVDGHSLLATGLSAQNNLVSVYDSAGRATKTILPLTSDDLNYSDGITGMLGRMRNGRPMAVTHRPGFWYAQEETGWTRHGLSLIGDKESWMGDGVLQTPGQAYGGASFDIVPLAIHFTIRHRDGPRDHEGYLAFFDGGGVFLGTLPAPFSFVFAFQGSHDGQSFFVALSDPFPHVARYRLLAERD